MAGSSRLNFCSISFGSGSAGVEEKLCTYDNEACLP